MNSRTTAERSLAPVNPVVLLDEVRGDIAPLLAENGQSFDRLRSTLMIAVQQNPDILKCTPESLRREISKCAADGLVPDNKEAVLLPYFDKDAKRHLANYQPMVYGIIKRMKELGSVFNIVCEIVCQNDVFSFNAADPDSMSHSWDVFSEMPRGATRAAYVIFRDDQKRVMHREIMTLTELQAIRAASKAPNSPAWRNFEGEMYQKAVLRRGSKYISINNDKIRTLIERQDELFDFSQPRTAERVDPFSGVTIDAEALKVEERSTDERLAEHQQQGEAQHDTTTAAQSKSGEVGPAPAVPDLDIAPMDQEAAVGVAEKLLSIAFRAEIEPAGRKELLKAQAAEVKDGLHKDLHPLAKACIDITVWAIRADSAGRPWAADHARFVHKLREVLGVETLNIGKYPWDHGKSDHENSCGGFRNLRHGG